MHITVKPVKILLVGAVSLAAALISAKLLAQGTPLVTLPWGLLAFLSACIASSKKEALTLGGYLGFVTSYAYLWFDNTSHLSVTKVAILIVLLILPALFGLLCGLLLAWLGWAVRKWFRFKKT